jgi:hypothetical protein
MSLAIVARENALARFGQGCKQSLWRFAKSCEDRTDLDAKLIKALLLGQQHQSVA